MHSTLQRLYSMRFNDDRMLRQKNEMWRVLVDNYFQKYLPPPPPRKTEISITVVDIAAGYCEFINNIKCDVKYACDLNPDIKKYCASDVMIVVGTASDLLKKTGSGIADAVFISNFLEHLDSKEAVSDIFYQSKELLRPGGRILILQPNIKYTGGKYWDFFDHKIPLTEKALSECAEVHGLKLIFCARKFLPYTTKSSLPKHPWIVRLYCMLMPISGLIFGEQSFLVFEK